MTRLQKLRCWFFPLRYDVAVELMNENERLKAENERLTEELWRLRDCVMKQANIIDEFRASGKFTAP